MDATEYVKNLTEEQVETFRDGWQELETLDGNPRGGKKKGRKPKAAVSEDAKAMDAAAKREADKALSIQEVDKAYLPDGETYNLHIIMERARFYQAQAANSLIELGKQILLLKHHEPHGQFLAALDELGMAERSAQYAMLAAQKFSNTNLGSYLGRTTLRVLSVLDDEQIATMEETGELPGVGTVDEIKQMSRKDLEAALREEKKKRAADRKAQDTAIEQKEKKINELEMELRYREPPTKEQLAQAALDELKKTFFRQVGEASYALSTLIQTIEEAQRIPDVTITQLQQFIVLEPEGFLSSIFDNADALDGMIENICPTRDDAEYEVVSGE